MNWQKIEVETLNLWPEFTKMSHRGPFRYIFECVSTSMALENYQNS